MGSVSVSQVLTARKHNALCQDLRRHPTPCSLGLHITLGLEHGRQQSLTQRKGAGSLDLGMVGRNAACSQLTVCLGGQIWD